MKFEIYQRKADKAWFLPLNPDDIRPSDYEKTYEGNINGLPDNQIDVKTLDSLFQLFNSDDRPTRNFTYSLSVNDMIKLNDQIFICLFLGWKKIEQPIAITDINENCIIAQ